MKIKAPGFRIRASAAVAFSPDDEHLAVIGRDVVLWNIRQRHRLRATRLLSHAASVAFAPDGASFVVKNTFGEFLTSETATVDPLVRFTPTRSDEGPAPLYRSREVLLDGSWAGEIRARDPGDLRPRVLWRAADAMVTGVRSCAGHVWAFEVTARHSHPDFARAADRILISSAPERGSFITLARTWRVLRSAALSPTGQLLAVRSGTANEHMLEVLDVESLARLGVAPVTQGGTGWNLCWSPEGTHVVVVERGGFSFRRQEDLCEMGWLPSDYPSDIAFSPSSHLIALGDWRNGLVAPWPDLLNELRPRAEAEPGVGAL